MNVLKYICPKLNIFVLQYFGSGKYLYLYLSTFKVLLPGSAHNASVLSTVTGVDLAQRVDRTASDAPLVVGGGSRGGHPARGGGCGHPVSPLTPPPISRFRIADDEARHVPGEPDQLVPEEEGRGRRRGDDPRARQLRQDRRGEVRHEVEVSRGGASSSGRLRGRLSGGGSSIVQYACR